jgi:hypothetical protein
MIKKIKLWLFGKVLFGKVGGKFIKHGATVLVALIFSDRLQPVLGPVLKAMELTDGQVEAGVIVILTGLLGSLANFIKHRLK